MNRMRAVLSLALLLSSWPAHAVDRARSSPPVSARPLAARLAVAPDALKPLPPLVGVSVMAGARVQAAAGVSAASAVAARAQAAASPLIQARALETAGAPAAVPGSEEVVWQNGRARGSAVAPVSVAAGAAAVAAPLSAFAQGAAVVKGAAAVPAAKAAPAVAAATGWAAWVPYGIGAAGLLLTHLVARAARGLVEWWGARQGHDENHTAWARGVTTIAVWIVGSMVTLHAAGVSLETALASVGGVGGAVALLIGQEITNLLESVKFLLARPFQIGDTIRKGGKDFKVKGLEIRYLALGVYGSSDEEPEYRQLSSTSITVMRPYEAPELVRREFMAASLWLLAAAGIVIGVPMATAALGWGWLTVLLPWMKAGALLFATRRAELWAAAMVEKIGSWMKWSRYRGDVASFTARAAVYVVGMSLVLGAFNITWVAAVGAVGVSSLILGWVVRETLQSLYFGIKILWTQPFRVGDTIEVATITGKVVEMNLFYVVLSHKEGTHTLVPYAVFKDNPSTRLSAVDADTAQPVLTPGSSLPPSQREAAKAAGKAEIVAAALEAFDARQNKETPKP